MQAGSAPACPLPNWLWQRLEPLVVDKMPLVEPPPRSTRFGSPLVLSRVHWVRAELVVEVSYVEWTPGGLLRHIAYLGEREDKLATDVHRSPPLCRRDFKSYLVMPREQRANRTRLRVG